MSRPVEVVVWDLHLAATRLRDAGQRLQDGLSGVDLETREMLGSGWKGDAASAFAAAWEQWHNGAGQVVRGVQTMSDLLKVAGDQYARTDEQGAGALASTVSGSSSGPGGDGGGAAAPSGSPSAAAPTQSSAAPDPGSGSGTGAATQVGQLGGQVASGLAQAGQSAAGMVSQAAQTAAGLAQQVGQAIETAAEKAAEQSAKPEDRDDASPGEDANTGTAPVDQNRSDPQTRDGEVPG